MLALWVLRDEAGLRRAAGRLVIAGAVGALALAGVAARPAPWVLLARRPLAAAAGGGGLAAGGGACRRGRVGCAPGASAAGLALAAGAGGEAPARSVAGRRCCPRFLPAAGDGAALGAVSGLVTLLGLLPRF